MKIAATRERNIVRVMIVTTVILSGGTLLAWAAIAGMVIKALVSDQ